MEDRKQSNKSSLICAKNRRPVETREVYLGTPLLKNIFWYMDLFFWTRLRSIRIDHKSNFKASSLKSWRSLTTEVSLTTTFWNFFSFFLFSQVCFKCLIQLLRHGTPYRLGCLGQVWGIRGGERETATVPVRHVRVPSTPPPSGIFGVYWKRWIIRY